MKIRLSSRFQALDLAIVRWMARFGPVLLRVTLGIVFVWFGILKFFPNVSPAQELATRTITVLTTAWFQIGLHCRFSRHGNV